MNSLLSAGSVLLLLGTIGMADLVDFETTPGGGTPVDNSELTSPYVSGIGPNQVSVSFFFDTNGNNVYDPGTTDALPIFEKAGDSDSIFGFVGSGGNDVADPGFAAQLGNFFLRQPPPGSSA